MQRHDHVKTAHGRARLLLLQSYLVAHHLLRPQISLCRGAVTAPTALELCGALYRALRRTL
jgi:hypothetical protein